MNDRLQAPANAIPPDVLCARDYERLAPLYLAPGTLAYIAGGSGQDATAAANVRAFARWAVLPRVLRDVSQGHTRLTLAGQALAHPVLLAPLALHRLAHPRGEVETARGAGATDTLMLCSTLSTLHAGGRWRAWARRRGGFNCICSPRARPRWRWCGGPRRQATRPLC